MQHFRILFSIAILAFSFSTNAQWSTVFSDTGYQYNSIDFSDQYHGFAAGRYYSRSLPWGAIIMKCENGIWLRDTLIAANVPQYPYTSSFSLIDHINCLDIIDSLSGFAVAIGTNNNTSGSITSSYSLLYLRNNTGWSKIDSINGCEISACSFSSIENGWAVARVTDGGIYQQSKGLIFRYQSGHLNLTDSITFSPLSICTPDSIHSWIVGTGGNILYYDGQTWKQQITNKTDDILSISLCDTSFGFACGNNGLILEYSNGIWTQQFSNTTYSLNSISTVKGGNAWAVGQSGIVLSYSGNKWQPLTFGPVNKYLSVSFIDNLHGWAVGTATGSSGSASSEYGIVSYTSSGGMEFVLMPYVLHSVCPNISKKCIVTADILGRRVLSRTASSQIYVQYYVRKTGLKSNKIINLQ